MLKIRFIVAICCTFIFLTAQGAVSPPDEVIVNGGNFYVGSIFGPEDYVSHPNSIINSFAMMKTEVTYQQYHSLQEWADRHGFQFSEGCNGAVFDDCLPPEQDAGKHPVTSVSWWDAVIFANALSELRGLQPYYHTADGKVLKRAPEHDNDKAIHGNPQASGYRLPTIAEWHVAARGGEKGLANSTYGYRYAGSNHPENVAQFPGNTNHYSTIPVATKQPNALGLYDLSGNVAEWLDESCEIEGSKTMYYFCGGSYLEQVSSLASCDMHTPGFFMSDIGFRLVRSVDDK